MYAAFTRQSLHAAAARHRAAPVVVVVVHSSLGRAQVRQSAPPRHEYVITQRQAHMLVVFFVWLPCCRHIQLP